jgi:hypothetical protein
MATPTPPNAVSVYKGDTFIAEAVYRSKLGDPVDLGAAGISIEAWLRAKDNRRFPVTVTINGPVGHYQLVSATDNWPIGRNLLVIRYTQGAIKRTAQPVVISVEAV